MFNYYVIRHVHMYICMYDYHVIKTVKPICKKFDRYFLKIIG